MKSLRFLILIAVVLLLTPAVFAADFGFRAGRLDFQEGSGENFVGAEVLFAVGPVNVNPNVEYWLLDDNEFGGDVTAGTANLDLTVDFGSARVKPYVGAGIGLSYIDTDFGDNTETIGNLIGGVQFDLDFLKPYGQVKYTRSVENSDDDDGVWAFTVGLRF